MKRSLPHMAGTLPACLIKPEDRRKCVRAAARAAAGLVLLTMAVTTDGSVGRSDVPRLTEPGAPAGFQPTAHANVSVRFQPGASKAPRPSASSIYVRPGVDPATVRRSPARSAAAKAAAAPTPRQAQKMPDGRLRLISDPSEMTYATARQQPSGRLAVGCGANDSHPNAEAAKGGAR